MSRRSGLVQWLSARPYILAIFITIGLVGWMLSGPWGQSLVSKESAEKSEAAVENEMALPRVRVTSIPVQLIERNLTLYGRTEPARQVHIRAEIAGRIEQVFVRRGAFVSKGERLVKLAEDDLPDVLKRNRALLKQRQVEYDGVRKLSEKGFQGAVRLAEAEAALALARSSVIQTQVALAKTRLMAPVNGIVNERMVEVGDFVKDGDSIAMVVDINPLIVRADVTENDISTIKMGQMAKARLVSGDTAVGEIRYVSRVADSATNTFKIEVAIDNPGLKMLAGTSAEVEILMEEVEAIHVTPAVMALNEQGDLGVKTVLDNRVVFTPIELIMADEDGVWLSGFTDTAQVITVGQGFVRPGDEVEVVEVTQALPQVMEIN